MKGEQFNVNIFTAPRQYRDSILEKVQVPSNKRKNFDGKSFACVFFTKFCNAGCPFCFFRSDMRKLDIPQEKFEFSDYGFERFINFINSSNNGYLLISGGGEPFEKEQYVIQTVKRARTDRIVIVTSGIWAKDYKNAERIIYNLYEEIKNRSDNLKVVLRLSLDKFHYQQLGFELVKNIISIFKENFSTNNKFELQIQTMIDDITVDNMIKKLGNCRKVDGEEIRVSDNKTLVKIVPKRCKIIFDDGYEILVGMAKTFYPNLKVNLSNMKEYQKSLKVFEEDMNFSEYNNPSIVTNLNNHLGFDFWINYNGNITTWGNQQLDSLNNLYVDDYDKIVSEAYKNIISYSFLDKGYNYRENIIAEVNSKAVLRAKAVNIRDYSGALILEEVKTSLYYAIRVIQDYLQEGILNYKDIKQLPEELIDTIKLNKLELVKLYNNSEYSILSQYKENLEFNQKQWIDIFMLINLGHYEVTEKQIKEALEIFNKRFEENVTDISKFPKVDITQQYARLIERITFMKKEAMYFCMNQKGEKNGN